MLRSVALKTPAKGGGGGDVVVALPIGGGGNCGGVLESLDHRPV